MKKGTLARVFSCEFCGICKNTFSYRTPLVAASETTSCEIRTRIEKIKNKNKQNKLLIQNKWYELKEQPGQMGVLHPK